jgi:putative FmdB family regulatory protein
MPIYEYACEDCGHTLEKMQKMSDAPLTTCPECNKDSLRKLISAGGFQLKGGGWYETDFKNKPAPAPACQAKAGGCPSCPD